MSDTTRCPVCGLAVILQVAHDGLVFMPYHDDRPPCRSVCMGSTRTVAQARRMVELRDYARERARYVEGHA